MATPDAPDPLEQWRTAEQDADYTKLTFTYGGLRSQAFIVRAVPTGFLACVPLNAAPAEDLAAAAADNFAGNFGPWRSVSIPAISAAGNQLRRSLSCGILDIDLAGLTMFGVLDDQAEGVLTFGMQRGHPLWPHPARALEAAQQFVGEAEEGAATDRLEAYYTGDSQQEADVDAEEENLDGLPLEPGDQAAALQQLLAQGRTQATTLSRLQGQLASVNSLEERLRRLERLPQAAPSPPSGPPPQEGTGASLSWAPQLFREAGQRNLSEAQARQLLQLAGRGPPRLGDIPEAARATASAPARSAAHLPVREPAATGGVGTIEGAEDEGEDLEGAAGEAGLLGRLLLQQTQILSQLAANSRKASDPLQALLSGSGDGNDGDTKATGVKGMAARQLLQEQYQKDPGRFYQRVRERLVLARRKNAIADLEPKDMYLHFQETVPLGNFKTLTYFAFLMAETWEAAEKGRTEEVLSLLASGLVFAEQVAHEGGHAKLGWLLTLRPEPPFAQVELRRAPRADVPHGILALSLIHI